MTPGLIRTLPGAYYTDPAIFAREQAAVFEAMWFCAARGSEVGTPGQSGRSPWAGRAC